MFSLSKRSLSKLEGVHPELVNVVKLAITLTKVDLVLLMEFAQKLSKKNLLKLVDHKLIKVIIYYKQTASPMLLILWLTVLARLAGN